MALDLGHVDVGNAKVLAPKIRESDLGEAVKGLWNGTDIGSIEPFLYPTFRVEHVVRRKHRLALVDWMRGRELAL